jgi:signal peptidase I
MLRLLGRFLAFTLLLVGVLVVSGKVRFQPVLTGSMAPRYPTGTLVAVTPVRDVQVGEVIMFVPPQPWSIGPVLHRVVSVDGTHVRTKGDANKAMDPWTIDASKGGLARLRGSSVAAGRAAAMVRASSHGPGLLVVPGLLLLWLTTHFRGRYTPRHALHSRPASVAVGG